MALTTENQKKKANVARVKRPQLLIDMRHVYKNKASKEDTESQKQLRKMWKDSPVQFLNQMKSLETAYLDANRKRYEAFCQAEAEIEKEALRLKAEKEGSLEEEAEDAGTDRCEDLIEALIEEWGDTENAANKT